MGGLEVAAGQQQQLTPGNLAMPKTAQGYLYFIRSRTLDNVKVGFAVDPMRRLGGLQTGNPHKLELGTIVPVDAAAERIFHEVMRPHRTAGEWYPDDTLMACIDGQLIEFWGDKVQDTNDGSHVAWIRDGDEYTNPLGVFLTGPELRAALDQIITGYFAMSDDDWDDDPPEPITNHWLPKPRRKVRKLRSGYV